MAKWATMTATMRRTTFDPGLTLPAGDLDGEIVAGLGAQPCPGRVDQQPAGLRSEPVGTGDAHGVRLRRCQLSAAATSEGLDHGGDREGTCGDLFGLRCPTSRPAGASGPATTPRSPEIRSHAAPGKADPGVGARGGWPKLEQAPAVNDASLRSV